MATGECTRCEIEIYNGKVINWHVTLERSGDLDSVWIEKVEVQSQNGWELRTIRFAGPLEKTRAVYRAWFDRWKDLPLRCPRSWHEKEYEEAR